MLGAPLGAMFANVLVIQEPPFIWRYSIFSAQGAMTIDSDKTNDEVERIGALVEDWLRSAMYQSPYSIVAA